MDATSLLRRRPELKPKSDSVNPIHPHPVSRSGRPMPSKKMNGYVNGHGGGGGGGGVRGGAPLRASFMTWTLRDILNVPIYHWIPSVFALGLLFFMGVEYTLHMVPPSSPPFDIGFIATRRLHHVLASSPQLNTLLAGLNTVLFISYLAFVYAFLYFVFSRTFRC